MNCARLMPKALAAFNSKLLLNLILKKQKAAMKDRGMLISKEKILERIMFSTNQLKLWTLGL